MMYSEKVAREHAEAEAHAAHVELVDMGFRLARLETGLELADKAQLALERGDLYLAKVYLDDVRRIAQEVGA